MKSIDIIITNPTGLHTRPGAGFVKAAKNFTSEISVRNGDKVANGKSLMKLLQVGISCHDRITISADGFDEDAALHSLGQFINSLTE